MDLDEPELIQALDDFTKQILSPGNMLSSRLEAAFSSDPSTASDEVNADVEIGEVEGSRIEFKQEEAIEAAIDKLNAQIQPLILISNVEPAVSAKNDIAEQNNDDTLPLSEPVFQILSDIFDDFNAENSSTSPQPPTVEIRYIPEEENIISLKHQPKKDNDFNALFESYPYDSWDSPGSVESDLFPDLAF